jgi:hypothetical protein
VLPASQMIDQFALLDDFRKTHLVGAIDQLKRDPALSVKLPDHLQHQ